MRMRRRARASSVRPVDEEHVERRCAARRDREGKPPVADHHERRRGVLVEPRRALRELVGLRLHLHVQHGEGRRDVGAGDRLPVLRDLHREVVRNGGAVRVHVELQLVAVLGDDLRHGARARLRGRVTLLGQRARRRGRLESTAATATADATSTTSALTSPRRRVAIDSVGSGLRKPGTVRRKLTDATPIAASRIPALTRIASPYEVCQRAPTVGSLITDAATPVPNSTITESSATFEKRGTQTVRPASRRAAPRLRHSTSSPISPPTHSEPDATCNPSRTTESARGDVCAACPATPGTSAAPAAASSTPPTEKSSAIVRGPRCDRSTQNATAAATARSASTSSRSR